MKKLLTILLLLTLILSCVTSCGVYKGTEPQEPIEIPGDGDEETPSAPEDEKPENGDTTPFTVQILYDEEIFTETDGIQAQWKSKSELHRADFDPATNTASITGLDGDYEVTLYGLPETYMYDTNVYKASNNSRAVVIEIFKHINTKGTGAGLYLSQGCISVNRIGAYTATIKKAGQYVYYEFTPPRAGTFIIDTIVDVTVNEVNPSFNVYTGTTAAKYYDRTIDSGASEAEYTRNVRYTVEVEEPGPCFTFGITATHKDGEYPVEVSFIIRYAGYEAEEKTPKDVIVADQEGLSERGIINADFIAGRIMTKTDGGAGTLEGTYTAGPVLGCGYTITIDTTDYSNAQNHSGTLTVTDKYYNYSPTRKYPDVSGAYTYTYENGAMTVYGTDGQKTTNLTIDASYTAAGEYRCILSTAALRDPSTTYYPEIKVSDGIYRFEGKLAGLNEADGYYHCYNEATGEFDGPIIYAKLRRRTRFFADYTPPGSSVSYEIALDSYDQYSVLCIEDPGNAILQNLSDGTENYKLFIQGSDACQGVVGMEDYASGYEGYADYVENEWGVYPVTEELRVFLQKFSVAQRYFNDGNGWAESTAEADLGYRLYSSEDDQWLFACCYFY